jgi:GntR family transcriptional repressor for pyruvate dehydrogenase complex
MDHFMSPKFQPIGHPQNLYMEALRSIKEAIFRGDFAPGQALPSEKELSGMLGVSRPVLREALRVLQIQGFLDVRRGNRGGTYVTDLSSISIKDNLEDLLRMGKVSMSDLTQARILLEPEVFRLAAINASDAQLDKMEEVLQAGYHAEDPKLKIKLHSDFHRQVAKASGSPIYLRFMQIIFDFVEVFATTIQPEDFSPHEEKDHFEIFATLRRRDQDRVAELARNHAEHVTREMIRLERQWLEALKD